MIIDTDLESENLVGLITRENLVTFGQVINLEKAQQALSAPTSAVDGFEYLFHFEKERLRGEEWNNFRYFIRHTGKHHIVKLESREQGSFDFSYKSAEVRGRLPIGKKFSISAGAIYRTHERAYGYNPIEIWLNETEVDEFGNEYPSKSLVLFRI